MIADEFLCHICMSDTATTIPCKHCKLFTCEECRFYGENDEYCSVWCLMGVDSEEEFNKKQAED